MDAVYLFIRQDLIPAQQTIQAVHAAIEMSRRDLKDRLGHPNVILIGIKNLSRLQIELIKIQEGGTHCYPFLEPDLAYEMTAFITEPLTKEERVKFKHYNLKT